MRNPLRTLPILLLGLFIAACGGGSGAPSNQPQSSTPNAVIKAVNGVGVSGSGGAVQALLGATIQISDTRRPAIRAIQYQAAEPLYHQR